MARTRRLTRRIPEELSEDLAAIAEEPGLSIYDMMDEVGRRGLGSAVHHTLEEAREDLARLLPEVGLKR